MADWVDEIWKKISIFLISQQKGINFKYRKDQKLGSIV